MGRAMAASAASIDPVAARVTPAADAARIAVANATAARAPNAARGIISSGTAGITNAAIVPIAAANAASA